ncbi:MAG: tetratricopeptide repeat protein [Deltaproteobacteria bacterium]|nr:tetratricopeptide repeat protein [Deltaproteobacteria bacterium]
MTDLIRQYNGRVVDSPGDNLLSEFSSAVDATECAVAIQKELGNRNAALPDERKMAFRIGINLGDVIADGDRLYGDGINIAARIESLALPGGICISGTIFDQIKNKLRLGIEDLGKHRAKNIAEPLRVYRVKTDAEAAGFEHALKDNRRKWVFIIAGLAVMTAIAGFMFWSFYPRHSDTDRIENTTIEQSAFPLPDKPSIAVLPFENLSEESNQEYIADGLTENITAALSKISEMFVISRNSTAVYKNKPAKIQQVSKDLGVRYILAGSIQKSGDSLRITAQLIDSTTGYQLWAERYDRRMEDLFEMQDEITLEIIGALEVELTSGERSSIEQTTKNLAAWGYYIKGVSQFERFDRKHNQLAREYLEKAVEVDPNYAAAWTQLAWTYVIDAWFGYSKSPAESIRKAEALSKKVAALGGGRPDLYSLWSTIYLNQGDYDKAVDSGLKAVAMGPNNALAHVLLAYVTLFAGKSNEAVASAERAIRLTPYCPDWYLSILGQAYRQAGRFDKAYAAFKKALDRSEENKNNPMAALLGLIDVSEELGRSKEAKKYADAVRKISPDFSFRYFHKVYPYKNPDHLEPILSNLRKAGLK